MKPCVDIVIVNWNTRQQLRGCLQSIATTRQSSYKLSQIIVIDNASTDGSAEGLEDMAIPLTVVRNTRNRGFAAACNQGAGLGFAEYILFLNPDTVLYETSLDTPIRFLHRPENAHYGLCGVQLVDDNGNVWRSCCRFPTLQSMLVYTLGLDRLAPRYFPSHVMTDWGHDTCRDVEHVIGAFFLLRRKLFEALDGFDESFFVYMEDVDFSKRAYAAHFRSHYLASARVYHKGGGASEQVKATRLFYSLRSRIIYVCKHFARPSAVMVLWTMLFVEPFIRIMHTVLSWSPTRMREILYAYGMLWRAMPQMLRTAKGMGATTRHRI
jgi:N-acetylglucosaminyl-diphospho-decaprenol L-rhamnosyltransferase